MKRFAFFVFVLISISIIQACSSTATTTQDVKPTPIPDKNTPKDAIETFLVTKYPGWKLQGDTLDEKFNDGVQFDIHLQKDKEDKVLTVVLKKFQDLEGQYYWLLYEPTKLELAKAKIKQLKEKAVDDWQELASSYSALDDQHYDPR